MKTISFTSKCSPIHRGEQGIVLIEALIGILLFCFGVLALVGLQAVSVANTRDAKYRSDAAFLAEQIIGMMWGDVPNLATYAHNSNVASGASNCAFSGTASNNANVTRWLGSATTPSSVLSLSPGTTANTQQINVDPVTKQVTVTLCWKAPQDASMHSYVTSAVLKLN